MATDPLIEPVAEPRYWRLSAVGLLGAALFFAASLTPSLIPREPLLQGVLSGVSAAIGYVAGSFLVWLWARALALPMPGARTEREIRLVLIVAALAVAGHGLWRAPGWQDATRAAVDLPPVGTAHVPVVALVALGVFALLWLAGSAVTFVARRLGRGFGRTLPGRLGPVLGTAAALGLLYVVVSDVVARNAMAAADAVFARIEGSFDPGAAKPSDPMMTGSDASLVTWEALGNRGRDFVARTPSAAEIAAWTGAPAQRPVRVYVGRVSAGDPYAGAELALAELIRQGGFEREILIVTTPVGSGWMDPGSHDTVDFMWGGDTAHVAAQYSYLTSILSILTDVDCGLDQAAALFEVIHGHWTALPRDDRPRLYIHGLSQGALNSQAALPLHDILADPVDGPFWAGSPFVAPIWADIRRGRVPGSPAWRPRYGNGSLVRVANQEDVYDAADAPWGPVRMVFLNYASDPIVNFDFGTLWRAPAWLRETPRAPDIAPEMRWFPVVTALQLALDMTAAPAVEGYGHFYVAEDYIDAWAALTDPPGWSAARADSLRAVFDARPPPW